LAVKLAGALNLENELQNVILAEFRSFAFLHSQGQRRRSAPEAMTSALPPTSDLPLHCANRRDGPEGDISRQLCSQPFEKYVDRECYDWKHYDRHQKSLLNKLPLLIILRKDLPSYALP
jgi:hypothetical protein